MDGYEHLLSGLFAFCKNGSTFVLREHELDRIPEELLYSRRRRLLLVAILNCLSQSLFLVIVAANIVACLHRHLLCMNDRDCQLRFDLLL